MKLKDKKMLITDLCARLPYGVYVEHTSSGFMGILHDIDVFRKYNEDGTVKDYLCYTNFFGDEACKIEYFKPYLFPLSSMTEEQKKELRSEHDKDIKIMSICMKKCSEGDNSLIGKNILYNAVDWCNKNHFDYRGLIEMGLAIDATDKNVY